MKSHQIKFDSRIINKPESKQQDGALSFSSLPPYFVPTSVCVSRDEDKNIILIFEYSNDTIERQELAHLTPGVDLKVGKSSGRIIYLSIDIDKIIDKKKKSTAGEISRYMKELFTQKKNGDEKIYSKNSLSAFNSVFENYGNEVFSHSR